MKKKGDNSSQYLKIFDIQNKKDKKDKIEIFF